jgi:hypothetical protein
MTSSASGTPRNMRYFRCVAATRRRGRKYVRHYARTRARGAQCVRLVGGVVRRCGRFVLRVDRFRETPVPVSHDTTTLFLAWKKINRFNTCERETTWRRFNVSGSVSRRETGNHHVHSRNSVLRKLQTREPS